MANTSRLGRISALVLAGIASSLYAGQLQPQPQVEYVRPKAPAPDNGTLVQEDRSALTDLLFEEIKGKFDRKMKLPTRTQLIVAGYDVAMVRDFQEAVHAYDDMTIKYKKQLKEMGLASTYTRGY